VFKRGSIAAGLVAVFLVSGGVAARADVAVEIDVGTQTMDVYVNGSHRYSWPVSTGRRGHATPAGSYRAKRLERSWFSSQYDDAPMPYSIFFRGGYAIHGTTHTKWLGQRASHGCVRLAPGNAARLFSLVSSHGPRNTRISITN
jgi:lipoprotein-anchoring transpeptidase ErfK/SrfK